MANRCTLHKTKLEAFKSFLDSEGIIYKNHPEVGGITFILMPTDKWAYIHEYEEDLSYCTFSDDLFPIVDRFLNKNSQVDLPNNEIKHVGDGKETEFPIPENINQDISVANLPEEFKLDKDFKVTDIRVKSCCEGFLENEYCPFFDDQSHHFPSTCKAKDDRKIEDLNTIPDWCPLKSGPIIVRLKE